MTYIVTLADTEKEGRSKASLFFVPPAPSRALIVAEKVDGSRALIVAEKLDASRALTWM